MKSLTSSPQIGLCLIAAGDEPGLLIARGKHARNPQGWTRAKDVTLPDSFALLVTESRPGVASAKRRFATRVAPKPCAADTRSWLPAQRFRGGWSLHDHPSCAGNVWADERPHSQLFDSGEEPGPTTHPSPVLRREGVLGKDAKVRPGGSGFSPYPWDPLGRCERRPTHIGTGIPGSVRIGLHETENQLSHRWGHCSIVLIP